MRLAPEKETDVLRRGLAVASELVPAPTAVLTIPFWTFVNIVAGVCQTGGRLLGGPWKHPPVPAA